jgi:S1-C subfamily serine protease
MIMNFLLAALFVFGSLQIAHAESVSQSSGTKVEQAVVELRILKKERPEAESKYKKKTQDFAGHAICSGSFIDDQGDIITAGHCAVDAQEIEVVTYDGKEYEAVILATSAIHDLALLHIDRRNTVYFQAAGSVTRGEKMFVLGSPLGISNSLSTGIVAKLDGDQTLLDCGVLPGNSGSAAYDSDYNMIGVVTAGYIVGLGTTHLNIAQSLDAVWFFIIRAFSHLPQ